MTEMDWTRPPSDYVVVDGETGGRFGIDVRAWPKPEWDGYRRIAFGGERRRWFSEDGVAYIPPFRLVLRTDPTIDERRLAWARMAHRRMDETLGNEAAIYSLAASLAEWRG